MRGVSVLWYVYGKRGVRRVMALGTVWWGCVGCLITGCGYRADRDGIDCAVL